MGRVGLLSLLMGLAALGLWGVGRSEEQASGLPSRMLWAWERPERLEFINPKQVGVAYLAGSFQIAGEQLLSRPRQQPLVVPPGTHQEAVFRIETHPSRPLTPDPDLQVRLRHQLVSHIQQHVSTRSVAAVQIDFDATPTERSFYTALLRDLKAQLPEGTRLQMTALVSWCLFDDWIASLPVDEAIPMFFRMGTGHGEVVQRLRQGAGLRVSACQGTLGLATDEAIRHTVLRYLPPNGLLGPKRRVYLFHPRPWTPAAVSRSLKEVDHGG
jgi:hypothetical protein